MAVADELSVITTEPASRRFVWLLTIAYVAVIAYVSLYHEPWRDEADTWLFVRDASLPTILARTRYAGTPALWFLCVLPLAKLGLPYGSFKVLHLVIAGAAMAVFAAYAPLPRLTKILVAASYYFAYEYSVIVRNYALSILLAFIAAALYPRRRERPVAFAIVLFLLFNVNAQGFVIAGTFAALFLLERIRSVPAVAMMLSGAVIAYVQVRTPTDPARHAAQHVFNPEALRWVVGNAFLPTLPANATFVVGIAVLAAVTIAIWRARDAVLMLWGAIAALCAIYAYIWLGGLRHAGFFLVLVLLAIWIAADRVRWPLVAAVLLNATLLFSDVEAFRYAVLDKQFAFSGAQEMAVFIRDHHLDEYEIAAHNLTQCEALLPFLPHTRFWYAGLGAYGTYLTWDAAFERALNVPYPVAELRARQHFAGKRWLLLFNVEMPDPPAHGFRLLYTDRQPVFEKTDERYWLYAPLR